MKERLSDTPLKTLLQPHTEAKVVLAGMGDDDLRKLAREKLSEALQVVDPALNPEMTRKLCAELLDRLDGKPGQAIQLNNNINLRTVVDYDSRIIELARKAGIAGIITQETPFEDVK